MYEFRFVQVSDLHFGADSGRIPSLAERMTRRNMLRYLRQLFPLQSRRKYAGRVTAFRPATHCPDRTKALSHALRTWIPREFKPDFIVTTGDVAATGHQADLAEAVNFFNGQAPLSPWNGVVAPTQLDVWAHVLPGNHDRYMPTVPYLPGNEEFDAVFRPFWSPTAPGSRVAWDVVEAESERLILVSADFSLRTRKDGSSLTGYLGNGRVYDDILRSLVTVTAKLQHDHQTKAVVWALHFPPKFPRGDKNLKMQGDQNLIAAAVKLDVRLILAGHTHQAQVYDAATDLTVSCAGSATQAQLGFDEDGFSDASSFFTTRVYVDQGKILKIEIKKFEYVGANNCFRAAGPSFVSR